MPESDAHSPAPLPRPLAALSRLPLSLLYACGACVAVLAHRVLRYRVGVVRDNLAGAFPQLEPRARRVLERTYYRRLGELAAEVLKAPTLAPQELTARVRLAGLERLRAELAAGRCVLVVAAHQCNWEWLLLGLSLQLGYPLEAAYKPLHHARGERWMQSLRTRFGSRLVPAKELLTSILRRREPRVIAMVADQEPVTSEYKWWTRFLNRSTAFYMGPEKIAQVTRFAVFFAAMRRLERGRYAVTFEPLAAAREVLPAGALTERYARAVEAQISAAPADWTWSHRRWKLRRPVYAAAADPLDQGHP
ncbi:MAG TPA: lysophospholipid acyltransferase family protein [Steroidobacteraceae bacterium]|nr:lysophospholipid acyltransferase family protein [Steroidobacteraceae bacterium]